MNEPSEDADQVVDLIAKFVRRELMPLENEYLKRLARGLTPYLPTEHNERLRTVSMELGLWGLDAPADMGGSDLPNVAMVRVWEELAKSPVPFQLPPDTPNLRMLQAIGTAEQKTKYLQPYIEGRVTSGIAISEPGAGGDPAGMKTRAVLDGDTWVLNGRKIWISNARDADFLIAMARVGDGQGREGITSFIVERGAPGFIVERDIPMVGGGFTYEVVFDDCRLPASALLGQVGRGYEPMQLRLRARRLDMGASAVGMTQRALDVMVEHAKQRVTFGVPLADRQAIQWWIADTASRLHACRLMVRDAAAKVDAGRSASHEISMVKVYATELAYDTIDHAMQTLGALGMTQETVLSPMWHRARLMRIYEGPSEVHRQSIARRVLEGRA
jgi:acyl-CoA dehydrogenase